MTLRVDDFPHVDPEETAPPPDGGQAATAGPSKRTEEPAAPGEGWTASKIEAIQEYWTAVYDVLGNIGVPFVLPPLGGHWSLAPEKAHRLAVATSKLIPYPKFTKILDFITENAPAAVIASTVVTDAAPKWERTVAIRQGRATDEPSPRVVDTTARPAAAESAAPRGGPAPDGRRVPEPGPQVAPRDREDATAAGSWPGPSDELLRSL